MTRAQNAPPQSPLPAGDVSEDGRAIRLGSSPLDLIDSGAGDDEPVKGVTHGHLRQWHDMFDQQSALIRKLNDEINEGTPSPAQEKRLLPCPFCGERPVTERTGFSGRALYIYCVNDNGCPRPKAIGESEEKALENWNTRAPISSVVECQQVPDESRMEKISALIARLQSTLDRWGDTCVYIRRGGLSWGAVALNRRDDDKKHGVFDLQAQHDRDMEQRAGQVQRLIADRNHWRERAMAAEALTPVKGQR